MIELIANNIDKLEIGVEPKLKLVVLNDIAEIVRKNIERNVNEGTGVDGVALQFKKSGRYLYDTGLLLQTIQSPSESIKMSTDYAEVKIGSVRTREAEYLVYGTDKIKPSDFFWVTKNTTGRTMQDIDKYLEKKSLEQLVEIK